MPHPTAAGDIYNSNPASLGGGGGFPLPPPPLEMALSSGSADMASWVPDLNRRAGQHARPASAAMSASAYGTLQHVRRMAPPQAPPFGGTLGRGSGVRFHPHSHPQPHSFSGQAGGGPFPPLPPPPPGEESLQLYGIEPQQQLPRQHEENNQRSHQS